MITGKEFIEKMYSQNNEVEKKLFSTGNDDLDAILTEVYYSGIEDGYDYAQKEFGIKEKGEEIIEKIKGAGKKAIDAVKETGKKAGKAVGKAAESVGDATKSAGEKVGEGAKKAANSTGKFVSKTGKSVKEGTEKVVKRLGETKLGQWAKAHPKAAIAAGVGTAALATAGSVLGAKAIKKNRKAEEKKKTK